jgi:hypothetical protein
MHSAEIKELQHRLIRLAEENTLVYDDLATEPTGERQSDRREDRTTGDRGF